MPMLLLMITMMMLMVILLLQDKRQIHWQNYVLRKIYSSLMGGRQSIWWKIFKLLFLCIYIYIYKINPYELEVIPGLFRFFP